MLSQMSAAWRMRRVLICGSADSAAPQLCAWLAVLGARPACLSADAGSETLCRALTSGRVSAVIICSPPASPALLDEIRESGVPLALLCPQGDAQEAALRALMFGAQFFEEGELPFGVYDLENMP